MREIKFRAWDRKSKIMWNVEELSWCDPCFIVANPGLEHMDIQDRDFRTKRVPDDIELMQYTGLKDKNGKEIYEEDIAQYFMDDNRRFLRIVEFQKGAFVFVHNSDGRIRPMEDLDHFEIIGNIYETPELLK